jgi:hypothetical protein
MGFEGDWAALALRRCGYNLDEAALFCMDNDSLKDAMLSEDSQLRRNDAFQQEGGTAAQATPTNSNLSLVTTD